MRITRWDQLLRTDQSNEVLFHLSRWHLSQCSESKQVAEITNLVQIQDLHGLCHYDLSFSGISCSDYRHLRQVLAFF
jgi:hypothetical protein